MARLPPLHWLRAFEASARSLSFTEAAQELNMTQSAVSQQIKSLETSLGRTLFLRSVRGLQLTDEGRGYLPTVQAAFAMLEEGTQVLRGRNQPDVLELDVNLSFALFWLSARLGNFLQQHPWVQLNLATSIWNEQRPNTSAAVRIVYGLSQQEGRGGKRLTHDQVFAVCAPAIAHEIHGVDDLLKQRMFDLPGTVQSWDTWLHAAGLDDSTPTPMVHRASTWALSLQWAQQGLGVALAHSTIAQDLLRKGSLVRPLAFSLPMKEAYFLIAPDRSQSNRAVNAFVDWLWQEIGRDAGPTNAPL